MQNNLALQSRQRARSWGCLERLLLIAFFLCLLVGLIALYLLFAINRPPAATLFDAPVQTLLVDQIVPPLAVRHLAGDSLDGLAAQAIVANELATGQALLLLDGNTPPIELAANWLDLAKKELEHQNSLRAAQATLMAQRIVLLDPRLQPLEKVQLLTQCARLYAESGAENNTDVDFAKLTLFTTNQAATIAAQTPNLLPAQRSQLFTPLQPLLATLENSEEQRLLKLRIDDFARNPFLSPSGQIVTPTLFSLAESSTLVDTVLPALLTRQDAAKAFTDRYLLTNGVDVEPERVALQVALLNENRVRLEAMSQILSTATAAQKMYLLQQQRIWLATQLRIALRGYGLSLVPEWEADISGIQRELNTNTNDLKAVFEQLATLQPSPAQQAMLRLEAILWMAEQFELGLYPNVTGEELAAQIEFAQNEVERLSGPLALPLLFAPSDEHLDFDFQRQ